MPPRICIVAAKRTPQGRFMGALAKRTAADLGVAAAKAALASARIDPARVDLVIVGNVLSAGLGQNVARQVGVVAGVPLETPAFSVNMVCASGLQAALLAAQSIGAGQAKTVLCGGTESMSNAPYLLDRARVGYKLGDGVLIDAILHDGLSDAMSRRSMGLGAETLAQRYGLSRAEQDGFALRSQQLTAKAQAAGRFTDEIAPVDGLEKDEHPRPDTALEKLAALKPAFQSSGTVTPGNSSGINDGAAMMVLCDEHTAKEQGWTPLAFLGSSALAACEPELFGLGPVYAIRKLCGPGGMNLTDFDAVELNEAFAAQALACVRELDLDLTKVNEDGGAIALGHPIGASGARLLTHLAHRVHRGEIRRGLASLCVGGGMGVAAVVEA